MRLPVGFKNIKKHIKKTPAEIILPLFFFPVQSILHNSSLSCWQIGTGEARNWRRGSSGLRRVLCSPWPNGTKFSLEGDCKLCTLKCWAACGLCAWTPLCLVCAGAWWAHLAQHPSHETGIIKQENLYTLRFHSTDQRSKQRNTQWP